MKKDDGVVVGKSRSFPGERSPSQRPTSARENERGSCKERGLGGKNGKRIEEYVIM